MSWSGMRRLVGARFVLGLMAACLVAAVFATGARAGKSLDTLREEYRQETDPFKRAKFFHKLGNALIAEMRKDEEAGEYAGVPPLFLEYRDSAKAAFEALMATGRNAEKHPKGFRELEIHLRQSLRALNDLVFGLPLENRGALLGPQHDVEAMDDQLVRALFPSTKNAPKTPPSAAHPHPGV
jgi:hypothetical protein